MFRTMQIRISPEMVERAVSGLILTLFSLGLMGCLATGALAQEGSMTTAALETSSSAVQPTGDFRVSIAEAAIVSGERVTLGQIGRLHGSAAQGVWEELAAVELFPAPTRPGVPMTMTRRTLSEALAHYLGPTASRCILPANLTLQKGGKLLTERMLAREVVKNLTPKVAGLHGEIEFRDFKLPGAVFLADATGELQVEAVTDVRPGRISLHLTELRADGRTRKRYSGSVFMDCWRAVPAATRPLNRGDALSPEHVTHVRKNVAFLRDEVWDGQGGPWRLTRSVGAEQVLYVANLETLPLVSKGDEISLVYESASLTLTVPAEALEDGGIGEWIAVRNLHSNREINARVDGHRRVLVR